MKISACLVIRNEQKTLQKCLNSIKDVVDEVIVVHDGKCSDNSLKIAKKYNAKIFVNEHIGEAEYHRPFSYERCANEWILQIDADEYLGKKAIKEIPNLIKDNNYDAYSFSWPYPNKTGYIKRGPFSKTLKAALFRKKKMFMIGIAHEYPRTYGKTKKRRDLKLCHEPSYDNFTFHIFKTKWIVWAKLQAKQIVNIRKAPTFNIPEKVVEKGFSYYTFMVDHPFISGFKESLRNISIYLSRGLLWSDARSIKIAIFEIAYLWLLRLSINKYKYEF